MKSSTAAILLVAAWTACSYSQQVAIDLTPDQNDRCAMPYVVNAADPDPSLITPESIFAANQSLAAKGNTEAAWNLGLAYVQGFGVRQDQSLAEHWFEIGATDPDEKNIVGGMYVSGICFSRNLDAADRWLRAAGRPVDLLELAQAYKNASPPELENALPIYLGLLKATGHPEVRRAQMDLGDLVLDGKYSAGNDAKGRALNMEWARRIAQVSLGEQEYSIAMDYGIGQYDVPKDPSMWLRYCRRAAAYDVDLAQHFYAEGMMDGTVPDPSGYEEVAWTRLASEKRTDELALLKGMESSMTAQQRAAADAAYEALLRTRRVDGAYYPEGDPLRDPAPAALAAMPQDDPDAELRKAFSLERAALTNDDLYRQVMDTYRMVRDRREIDVRFILGRNLLTGANGFPKDPVVAKQWLSEAAKRGSKPAQDRLSTLTN